MNQNKYIVYRGGQQLSKNLRLEIDKDSLYFGTNKFDKGLEKWKRLKMGNICQMIQTWKAKLLEANCGQNQFILKEIQQVHFPHLQYLNVSQNGIETIESLHRIAMPKLKNIYLWGNKLVRISSIRKCQWPVLQQLSLHLNYLQFDEQLTHFQSKKQKRVNIEYLNDQNEQGCNISWVVKLQATALRSLTTQSRERINQRSVLNVIGKKYLEIKRTGEQ